MISRRNFLAVAGAAAAAAALTACGGSSASFYQHCFFRSCQLFRRFRRSRRR